MRKFLLSIAALGAGVLGGAVCSPLFAEEGDTFSQLDTNKDGFITEDEVEGSKKALFDRLLRVVDENGDKKLSKEEFAKGTKKSTEEKPDAKPEAKAEAKAETKTEAKTESKTETKTDTKTETKPEKKTPASTAN